MEDTRCDTPTSGRTYRNKYKKCPQKPQSKSVAHLCCHSITARRGPGTLRACRLLLKLQLLLLLLLRPKRKNERG